MVMKNLVGKTIGVFASLAVCCVVFSQQASAPQKFETPISEVPFARIAETHEIDLRCPARGKEDNNIYHYAQNAAKNNFAAKGKPVPLRFDDFTLLQRASDEAIRSGKIVLMGRYPQDRTRLHNLVEVRRQVIGEGTVVSLEAYVFNANYASTKYSKLSDGRPGRGEAVDCDNPELDWNDIHIALTPTARGPIDECTTLTAEISPHFRPAVWSRFHDGQKPEIEESSCRKSQRQFITAESEIDRSFVLRREPPAVRVQRRRHY
jgi:hypothetical protein